MVGISVRVTKSTSKAAALTRVSLNAALFFHKFIVEKSFLKNEITFREFFF
jgi:hypothetical protein